MDKLTITLEKGQKVFFTSDPHYGHRNIIKFCNRPYNNTKEMEQALIKNWNDVVSNNDIVFILGDIVWFEGRNNTKRILDQLKGKEIHIIPGNHDNRDNFEYLSERFIIHDSIVTCYIKSDTKIQEIFLCHFPMATWPHHERSTIHLFGHIHSGPNCNNNAVDVPGKDLLLKFGKCYDVGVDNNNYTPIELAEISNKLNSDLVSDMLEFLERQGWSDLIDAKWKGDVLLQLEIAFPGVPKEIIQKVLNIVIYDV